MQKVINQKFILCFFIYLGCIINYSTAQINLGLQFGTGFSGLNANPAIKQKAVRSNSMGLSFRYDNPQYPAGFQSNLLYQTNGWHEKSDTVNYSAELNSLTLDFNTTVVLGNKKLKYLLSAGPFISRILNNKVILESGNPYFEYEYGTDFSFYYGISGAIGIQYHFEKSMILLDVKGYNGLSPLFKKKPDIPFINAQQIYALISLTWYLNLP